MAELAMEQLEVNGADPLGDLLADNNVDDIIREPI